MPLGNAFSRRTPNGSDSFKRQMGERGRLWKSWISVPKVDNYPADAITHLEWQRKYVLITESHPVPQDTDIVILE